MAETAGEAKTSYPYISANQWFGIRARIKQAPPKSIDIDWIIATLDTTQKTARNILPQLRTLGLVEADFKVGGIVDDLRHDDTYTAACHSILERVYPEGLRNAHSDAEAEPAKVASWFSRNARTGEVMSKNQAKAYLLLLGGQLPADEDLAATRPRKRSDNPVGRTAKPAAAKNAPLPTASKALSVVPAPAVVSVAGPSGAPTLHIDLQIHVSADAGDSQIDAIFKSMSKHLYGR